MQSAAEETGEDLVLEKHGLENHRPDEQRRVRRERGLTRRTFHHFGLVLLPLVYGVGVAAGVLRFLRPLPAKPRQPRLDTGPVTDFVPGGVPRAFEFNERKVYVLHDGTEIRAFDAQCTHLTCNVDLPRQNPAAGFACHCHGARFSRSGVATAGPTKLPLREYKLADLSGGRVIVLDELKPAPTTS
jgi:nitrite reductase/ring-hydroxylating ferredoxin subunit